MDPQLDNALLALRKDSRVLRHRRAFADCFGANPVASALGNRPRRDPGAAVRTYHEGLNQVGPQNRNFLLGWEPELSTWLRQLLIGIAVRMAARVGNWAKSHQQR